MFFSDYPYPLLSDRSRKPLFYETGHTIMNLLTDMRNFTYTLPAIPGCTVALDDDKTVILIPMDQYNQVKIFWYVLTFYNFDFFFQVLKILQSSNEHVLAWAASLHKSADAHLVCVQQMDTSSYTSQTINRENHGRKLTGACFVVFNASLKAGGATSRISIVEDGLMIQVRIFILWTLKILYFLLFFRFDRKPWSVCVKVYINNNRSIWFLLKVRIQNPIRVSKFVGSRSLKKWIDSRKFIYYIYFLNIWTYAVVLGWKVASTDATWPMRLGIAYTEKRSNQPTVENWFV